MRKFPKVWAVRHDGWQKAKVALVKGKGFNNILVAWEDTGEYEWLSTHNISAKYQAIGSGSGVAADWSGSLSPPSDTQNVTHFYPSAEVAVSDPPDNGFEQTEEYDLDQALKDTFDDESPAAR